jgi:hypothetical protein
MFCRYKRFAHNDNDRGDLKYVRVGVLQTPSTVKVTTHDAYLHSATPAENSAR